MDRLTRFKTHEQQFGVMGNKRQGIYTQLPVLDSPQYNDEKNEDSCETQGDDDINKGGRQRS